MSLLIELYVYGQFINYFKNINTVHLIIIFPVKLKVISIQITSYNHKINKIQIDI